MPGRLPISLLSAVGWGTLSNALVPADPTITAPALLPRQNDDRFIGWVEAEGTWFSQTCNTGLTWYQDGKYAQCCPNTLQSCYAPTACVDGSLVYPYSDISSTRTIACTENYGDTALSICNTAFIFENFDDSSPKTDIVCGDSSVNWSYYRKIPASATEIVSSEAPSSLLASAGSAQSSSSKPTATQEPHTEKEESKAWIAGAVIGPLAGLAIIGAIIFFLIRRKKPSQPQQGAAVAPGQPPPGVQPYSDAKPQMSPQGAAFAPAYNANEQYNQGYGQHPTSPAPQYASTYGAPGSPPMQNAYGQDAKYGHQEPSHPQAAELGGASSPTAPASNNTHTAELSGESAQK